MRPRQRKVVSTKTPTPAIAPPTLADEAVTEVLELHDAPTDGIGSVDPQFRDEMIRTTAYYMAEQRGFQPGHELDDWIAAEAAVDSTLSKIPAGSPPPA